MDAFFPLSIPLGIEDEGHSEAIANHVIRQRAISDLIALELSAADFLNVIELSGVDVDIYMGEVIPIISRGISSDLIWLPE